MAVVVYKCDTCKRVVELPQHKEGMDTVGRCVITDTCKGKLRLIKIKQSFVSGKIPKIEENLNDWIARKSLFTFNQNVAVQRWKVKHNLNANVSVQVYTIAQTPQGADVLVENTDNVITIVSANELYIDFPFSKKGTVQCISRSTALESLTDVVVPVDSKAQYQQVSVGSVITIATPDSVIVAPSLTGVITFLSPSTAVVVDTSDVTFVSHSVLAQPLSPWRSFKKATIAGITHTIWSVVVPFKNIPDNSPFSLSLTGFAIPPGVFLISATPHTQYDISLTKYINLSAVSTNENAVAVTYTTTSEFYIAEQTITNTYPQIFTA